jgi:cytochrome c553
MKPWLLLLLGLLLSACGSEDSSLISTSRPAGLLLNESHGDNGLAWGIEACDTCHAITVIHQDTSQSIREIVRDKGFSSCTGCHGSNGTSAPRQCLICHNEIDLPGTPYLDGNHSHNFFQQQNAGLKDSDCLVCHHASNMDGSFDLNLDLTIFSDASGLPSDYIAQADFCLRCHNRDHQQSGYEMQGDGYADPLIAMEDDYRYIDYHGWRDGSGEGTYHGLRSAYRYPQLVACSDCHALHGTSNEKLIIDNSAKGTSMLDGELFLRSTFPIEVNEQGDYSQLCVVCHEMTLRVDEGDLDTGNGLSGVHLVGQDCRPCHTHGEASQVGL